MKYDYKTIYEYIDYKETETNIISYSVRFIRHSYNINDKEVVNTYTRRIFSTIYEFLYNDELHDVKTLILSETRLTPEQYNSELINYDQFSNHHEYKSLLNNKKLEIIYDFDCERMNTTIKGRE